MAAGARAAEPIPRRTLGRTGLDVGIVAFGCGSRFLQYPAGEASLAVLEKALGAAGLVDAAATVAAFHGFVRLADAIGIPYTTAARGQDLPDLRAAAGIDAFHRVRSGD